MKIVHNLPVQKNLPALRPVDFSYLVLFFLQLSWNTEEYLLGQSDTYIPLNFAYRANSIQGEDLQSIAAVNKIAMNIRYRLSFCFFMDKQYQYFTNIIQWENKDKKDYIG